MGRLKTSKEREDKKAEQRRSKKITRGNPHVETEIKPVDPDKLTSKSCEIIRNNSKRGWVTRNSECPCGSHRRFKNCCMKWKR